MKENSGSQDRFYGTSNSKVGTRAKRQVLGRYLERYTLAVPAVCFTGALLTDLQYMQSPDPQWSNFSAWLLLFGVLFCGLGTIASAFNALFSAIAPKRWLYVAALLVITVSGMLNNLVHSRDGWTAVYPQGVVLSATTVFLMIVAGFIAALVNTSQSVEDLQ